MAEPVPVWHLAIVLDHSDLPATADILRPHQEPIAIIVKHGPNLFKARVDPDLERH